jgi:hypothetical protein
VRRRCSRFHGDVQRNAGDRPQRRQSEEDRHRRGNGQRKQQHLAVGLDEDTDARPHAKSLSRRSGKPPAQGRAGTHQHQALQQQLQKQGAPAGAQRLAQAEFALPAGIPRNQEHSHVGAGDQQDQPDHGHQKAEGMLIFLAQILDAADAGKEEFRLWFVRPGGRSVGQRIAKRRTQLCRGLLRRNAWTQASDQDQRQPLRRTIQRMIGWRRAKGIQLGSLLQRNPKIHCRLAGIGPLEPSRRDAHDGEGDALHVKGAAQHVRRGGKAAVPVCEAQHGDGRMTGFILGSQSAA